MRDRLSRWLADHDSARSRRLAKDRVQTALKCGLAAAAAWELALVLGPTSDPYYAPMVAFLIVQPTMAGSLRSSVQYLAASLLGIGVALAVAVPVDGGVTGVAITVAVGVLLGGIRWFGAKGVDVAFWALFVLVVGGGDTFGYVQTRLPEAAIGALVGVVVNLVVVPPLRMTPAHEGLDSLREDLAEVFDAMADDLDDGWPPENPSWDRDTVEGLVRDARSEVRQAAESLRWNPRARRKLPAWRRQQAVLDHLERIALSTRTMSRMLLDAADPDNEAVQLPAGFRPLLAGQLRRTRWLVRHYESSYDAGTDHESLEDGRRELADFRTKTLQLGEQDPPEWFAEGAILVELEHIHRQLDGTVADLDEVRDDASTTG